MVRVRYISYLVQVAGLKEELVPLPASRRLDDLLGYIAERHPGILGEDSAYQWRHGSTHVVVAINDHVVEEGDQAATPVLLAEGDQVTLMAALGGGSGVPSYCALSS